MKIRPHSAIGIKNFKPIKLDKGENLLYDNLSQIEQNILKCVIDENERSNNWVRIFPTSGIQIIFW